MYGAGYEGTATKIKAKIARACEFATEAFPRDRHRYEIWTPVVPSGLVARFERLAEQYTSEDLDVTFVANQDYTARVQELVNHARRSTKATAEPAYRMIQILTHLRGEQLQLYAPVVTRDRL